MILSRVLRGAAGKLEKRPAEAPQSLMDIVLTLAEAIRFGYAETLGTWHLFDLPRAILYTIMDKVHFQPSYLLTYPFIFVPFFIYYIYEEGVSRVIILKLFLIYK